MAAEARDGARAVARNWSPRGAARVIAASVAITLAPLVALAQRPTSTLVVDVADEESGTPLVGAEVRVAELHRFAHAEVMGVATIARIPAGVHQVEARFLGYDPISAPALFKGDDTVEVVLLMRRATRAMDTVRVNADRIPVRLEQFEFRRKLGFGHFLTEKQLDKDAGRQLVNVLSSRLPGVRIVWDVVNNKNVIVSTRVGLRPCRMVVIIDGIPDPDPDVDMLQTTQLAGVELYDAANVPAEFRLNTTTLISKTHPIPGEPPGGTAECGVLALWTR